MPHWDGNRWIYERAPQTNQNRARSKSADWLSTGIMALAVAALTLPFVYVAATGPQLALSPSQGEPATRVTATISGVAPGTAVQLTWDGSVTGLPSGLVSRKGDLRLRFLVPTSALGTHQVAVMTTSLTTRKGPLNSLLPAGLVLMSAAFSVAAPPPPTQASTPAPTAVVAPTSPATTNPTAVATAASTPIPLPATPAPTAIVTATPLVTATQGPTPPPTPTPTVQVTPAPAPAGLVLTFAAEFTNGLSAFAYDGQWGPGFGSQSDFMGDLRQVSVANGVATIVAEKKSTPSGRAWASAIMSTRGRFAQQYGYFEARIRYTAGNGLWPAFWMNPSDGSWPPEIDIVEAYPNLTAWPGPSRIYSTLHYGSSNLTHEVIYDTGVNVTGSWHTYAVDWQPGSLTFYFDGRVTGRITQDVPSKPHYLILNLAVGNWSALADLTTPNGSTMQIDYVRVYR